MLRTMLSRAWFSVILCLAAGTLPAHGGQYRAPAVPGLPLPGSRPTTPSTGGIPRPMGPGGPSTADRLGPDPTRWQIWWELEQDRFMRRRPGRGADGSLAAASGIAVTDDQRVRRILPALRRALESTTDREIVTACLIAIGKIGKDHPDFEILPLLQARLRRGDQEVRESAALAMGMTGKPEAIEPLAALLRQTALGKRLVGKERVDDRTRAFAAYGLGLVAYQNDDADVKQAVLDALLPVLRDPRERDRDVLVAVINGVRQLRPLIGKGAKHRRLQWQAVETLQTFEAQRLSKSRQLVQAHVPVAIARLLGRGRTADHERAKKRYSGILRNESRYHDTLPESAALALGVLVEPEEVRPEDAPYSEVLYEAVRRSRDEQTRRFATISLGRIGGRANEERLLRWFARAKGPRRSWAALALGLLARGEKGRTSIGEVLHRAFLRERNRDERSAIAIALGLARYTPAAEDLVALLKKHPKVEDLTGYLCTALALMEYRKAAPLIEEVMLDARLRPFIMGQAALALARLQQRDSIRALHRLLRTRSLWGTITLAATSSALGVLGDARSVEPLISMLEDRELPKLVRAFAAVALGLVADGRELPWNAWIAEGINYRALVETLSNGSSGVLDIL